MPGGKIYSEHETNTDIHSAIAKIKGSSSDRLNDRKYWEVKREENFVLIDDIRQKYIKEVKTKSREK